MSDLPLNNVTGKLPPPDHPGLGLVRVTEAAALAAGRWMGLGDRAAADRAAQEAMAQALDLLSMRGRIISGEELRIGEHSPLDSGKDVGRGEGPDMDVEVNAIVGAALAAEGRTGAISAAALAPRGCMWNPGPAVYLNKLVVDRTVAGAIGPEALDAPAGWTLALVARQKGKDIRDLVVFVVARPRHQDLIQEIRRAGARVFLRNGGDISGALMAADPHTPVDLLMGVGGAAEGLLSACAVKALGGVMLCRVSPQSEGEKEACLEAGMELNRILTCEDMVAGDKVYFSATGVTDSVLLEGAHYHGDTAETQSMVLRFETGTRRMIKTEHRLK
ncbi:MAG: class II fructose-bisphosphatase [bacterium]